MFLQFNHRKHAKNTILMSMLLVVKLQPGLHIQQYKKNSGTGDTVQQLRVLYTQP